MLAILTNKKMIEVSTVILCGGQDVCVLDHGELPRGVWHLSMQRHFVQPRVTAPWRDLCDAQDNPRLGQ